MLNRKFLTKVLNEKFRKNIILQNKKYIESNTLKLKQYATYVIDKHKKDRRVDFKDSKEMNYGYSPIDIIAYVAKDGNIKKLLFEFNSINHFLIKNDYAKAIETMICILSQLSVENKKDILCFDIDKIEADAKKAEEEYLNA